MNRSGASGGAALLGVVAVGLLAAGGFWVGRGSGTDASRDTAPAVNAAPAPAPTKPGCASCGKGQDAGALLFSAWARGVRDALHQAAEAGAPGLAQRLQNAVNWPEQEPGSHEAREGELEFVSVWAVESAGLALTRESDQREGLEAILLSAAADQRGAVRAEAIRQFARAGLTARADVAAVLAAMSRDEDALVAEAARATREGGR